MSKYVLVQHSGFGYAGDTGFAGGIELRQVNDKRGQQLVEKGYAVYDDYSEADNASHAFMYPEDYEGMYPVAKRAGEFGPLQVDGLKGFRPHRTA